ncbi:AIPR family protein [Streptomyces macrosporus]|uniref:Abortive phage infection protein C-terminal domain-containing protein n=1 Tax=Streptomyces macrosporus TaxID=44032 RepID=A0ABP5XL81_9ACTN
MGSATTLPAWLNDYDSFSGHLDEQLADENPHGKGLRFVNFALALLPRIPRCDEFTDFHLNDKLSHDRGVDILAGPNENGQRLYVQSKFRLRRASEIDEIISQFEAYDRELEDRDSGQGALFSASELENRPRPIYAIITSSKIDGVLSRYKAARRSSRPFYDSLVSDDRLLILDGPTLLLSLQSVYRKSFEVPSLLELKGATDWLNAGSVHVGILSGVELLHLYDEHGDGLFFENIRSFLGLEKNHDRESVNRKIAKTVEETPEKMLERNNGITIRANRVERSGNKLLLESASIVNGCQTTMCIVARREFVNDSLLIPVKIVESNDLWEVAHSANYQNRVRQIDLDLAKYLRPQLVQREAARSGLSVAPDAAHGVTDMIAAISDVQITYEETKALYKGVFSERPTNIFDNNYSKLLAPVLEVIYEHQNTSDKVFSALFSISGAARAGRNEVSEIHAEAEVRYFQRFRKPEYSAYIALLAAGVVTGINLADRAQDPSEEAGRLISFLREAAEAAENRADEFSEAYVYAYEILSETGLSSITQQSGDALVSQDLHKKIVNTPYETYFETLKMRIRREKARRAKRR